MHEIVSLYIFINAPSLNVRLQKHIQVVLVALHSLTNHNTLAQTNQSEHIACFWGSGFIESGRKPVGQMTEEKAAYNKGETDEK